MKPKRSRKISTSDSSNLVDLVESNKPTKESAQSNITDIERAKRYINAMENDLHFLESVPEGMNARQLEEIYLGVLNGVDYKIYANPNISYQLMGIIRRSLENGINVQVIVKPNRVIVKAV